MRYDGTIISKGIAIEAAYLHESYNIIPEKNIIAPEKKNQALLHYEKAQNTAKKELEEIRESITDKDKANIFSAHIDIVFDEAIDEEIRESIAADGYAEDWAVYSVFEKYIKILSEVGRPPYT